MIPNCKKNELKIITNLYQIISKLEYTTETTFLQIISNLIIILLYNISICKSTDFGKILMR